MQFVHECGNTASYKSTPAPNQWFGDPELITHENFIGSGSHPQLHQARRSMGRRRISSQVRIGGERLLRSCPESIERPFATTISGSNTSAAAFEWAAQHVQ